MGLRRPPISDAELDVLKVLWKHGPATVREIHSRLSGQKHRWAYTTVLTLLSRLRDKGYVASDKHGLAHVFRPAVSREKLLRQRLKELANEICGGTATPLVHALVHGQRFSPEEIRQFRQLLDQLEGRKAPGGRGGSRQRD